jgi:hypothetical protein
MGVPAAGATGGAGSLSGTLSQTRRIAGYDVHLEMDDPSLLAGLDPWLDLFSPGSPGASRRALSIRLRSGGRTWPPPETETSPLAEFYYVRGFAGSNGRATFRGLDGSWLQVDPAQGVAEGHIPPEALDGPPWTLRDLFNAAFTTFLRADGAFPLHAAALDQPDGGGLLIAGAPMAGKTSLALNLIRRGWRPVADDKVILDSAGDVVRASTLLRLANIDPDLARFFPELERLESMPPAHPHSPKRALPVESIYGSVAAFACEPRWLVFPAVHGGDVTRWEPLDASAAFIEILRQTPVISERRQAAVHLDLLRRLIRQAPASRLMAGRDILEDPGRLEALGREMGVPVGPPLPGPVRVR